MFACSICAASLATREFASPPVIQRQRTAELIDARSDARQDLEDLFHPPLHDRLVLDGPPGQLEVLASR
jgi:hypothetical protein